jgi:hypothetical protein
VLILAATTFAEIPALRFCALKHGLDYLKQFSPRKLFLDLGYFHLDGFSRDNERNKNHKTVSASDAFTPESKVLNFQFNFVANKNAHVFSLKNKPPGSKTKSFLQMKKANGFPFAL